MKDKRHRRRERYRRRPNTDDSTSISVESEAVPSAPAEEKSSSDDEEDQHQFYRQINSEYKVWKKNSAYLYDLLISHSLEWPSLTVQWLPEKEEPPGKDNYAVQRLVLGTNASDDDSNYLMIAQVEFPIDYASDEGDEDGRSEIGPVRAYPRTKVQIIQQIYHDREVNRARYMPQNASIIATKTAGNDVYVFDYPKHPLKPPLGGACNPDLTLKGHDLEGYALSWSPFKQGNLLSGSDDSQICLWDINASPTNKALDVSEIFKFHDYIVEDVAWHLKHEYLFGTVGTDKHLHICDMRTQTATIKPVQSVAAHETRVNCLSFSPFNEWLVATGSTDTTVKLFDLRKIRGAIHTMDCHKGEVWQVGWNPKYETILASGCSGRRIMVWDLSRIGAEQTPEDAEEGPPELLFIHSGHTNKIRDFSWNPCEDWVVASVADDNVIQIWEMADHIYLSDSDAQ